MPIYDHSFTVGQITRNFFLKKTEKLLPKLAKKNLKDIFSQIGEILGIIFMVFIKFICTIFFLSRRTTLHHQLLNSLLQGRPYVFEQFLEAALRQCMDSDKKFVNKKKS